MAVKSFRAGDRLQYPITISRFLKTKGDEVKKGEAILQYTYKYKRTIGNPDLGEEREVQETGYADWDCPAEGTISKWLIKQGDVLLKSQLLVAIDEPCPHDQQYAGLCTRCGKDMKEISWASESVDTDRATISMVHDNVALTVSAQEARRAEINLQSRLLEQRKLSLVVDLDQTIIHACIEPTIGEWQRDPTNPNYEAVKDVRSFQLDDGPRGITSGCWYYIKLRPGLVGFLERMSELFEMHVYTMGTRAYAEQIANIVDPNKRLFGHRIISRDENGSLSAKSLQRLFPVSTNMVVVIDDRADVWPKNRPNLIKVTPYDFFKGIGDINSSFLPKREDMLDAAAPAPPTPMPTQNGDASSSPNAPGKANNIPIHEKAVADNGESDTLMQLQAEEQEKALEKQLKDRPLLHMQEELDKEDSDAASSSSEESPAPTDTPEQQNGHSPSPVANRHNLLRDDDRELEFVEKHLTALHKQYYEQYEARMASRHRLSVSNETIPDAGAVLEWLKGRVLRGCSIVLTGIVPQGVEVRDSEIGQQILSFGGDLMKKPTSKTTHLVVSSARPRTDKVRKAARMPNIKIVNQNWLATCLTQWKQVDETPFLLDINPRDRIARPQVDEDGDEEMADKSASPLRITIVQPNRPTIEGEPREDESVAGGSESDDEDEDEEGRVEDTDGVMPTEPASPVDDLKRMDWDDVEDELAEFMGSEIDSESEVDSEFNMDHETDTDTESTRPSRKRKMDDDEGTDNDESADDGTGSALSKKQKLAKERTTGLRNVKNAADVGGGGEGGGLPTPAITGDEEQGEEDFDDLEAALEAEFEAG